MKNKNEKRKMKKRKKRKKKFEKWKTKGWAFCHGRAYEPGLNILQPKLCMAATWRAICPGW
jgi:hypothetical protein